MFDCYYMDISSDCSYEQSLLLYEMLAKERQQKVAARQNTALAKKQLLSSAFLSYTLAKKTKIPANQLQFSYGQYGKPYLVQSVLPEERMQNVEFNLSHSGKYAVVAISDQPVGIDVERLKKNRLSIAKRFFVKEEYEDILSMQTVEEQNRRFLQYWTMKEAYVKYCGQGLSIPLNRFWIKRKTKQLSNIENGDIWFSTVTMPDKDYLVSVCSKQKEEIALFSLDIMKMVTIEEIIESFSLFL